MAEQLQYLPDGSEIPDETNCQFEGDQRVTHADWNIEMLL